MKTRVLGLFAAFAVMSSMAADFAASNYAKTIDVRPSGVGIAGTISDFPVLIRLSDAIAGFNYSDFQLPSGGDLVVTDNAGNVLAHEIDTWNPDGESLVWVKVPEFGPSTKLHVYYGYDGEAPANDAASVWSNYTAVWHMGDAENDIADSTGHGLTGVATYMPGREAGPRPEKMGSLTGVVGNGKHNIEGIDYYSNARNYWLVPSYDSFELGGNFVFSGWVQRRHDNGEFWEYLFDRLSDDDSTGWAVRQWGSKNNRLILYSGSKSFSPEAFDIVNNWVYLTLCYNGRKVQCYLNGELYAEGTLSASVTDNGLPLAIGGRRTGGNYAYTANFDEFRLSPLTGMTAERIAADYANMANPAFLKYGPAAAPRPMVNPNDYEKFIDMTVGESAVEEGARLLNFPVLVRLSSAIDGFTTSDFKSADGSDMVFTDEDGRVFAHEIDTWNPAGETLVWVKVPELERGAVIRCYYSADSASVAAPAAQTVWTDYAGVWHMGDDTADIADSTANQLNAVATGNKLENMITTDGVIGRAHKNQNGIDYYSGERNYWLVPSYDHLALGGTFTLSAWVKKNSGNNEFVERFFSRKERYEAGNGWEVESSSSSQISGKGRTGYWLGARGRADTTVSAQLPNFNEEWAHLTFVYDNTTLSVYTNGALSASGTIKNATDNNLPLAIGCNPTATERALGAFFDEIRLGAGAFSAERVAAEYATVKNADFLAYGSAQQSAALPPVLADVAVSATAAGADVSFALVSGKASQLMIVATPPTGEPVVTVVADEVGGIEAPQSYRDVAIDGLAANTIYQVSVQAVNMRGGIVVSDTSATVYNGTIAVAKSRDAREDHLTAGVLVFSRASGDAATALPLTVNYTVSGSAVEGVNYQPLAGSVVIPAGEASATVEVAPLYDAVTQTDTTLTVTVADGFYCGSGASADLTIVNLAPANKHDFKRVIELTVNAAALGEATVTDVPVLVRLSSAIKGFAYSDFQSANGADMMFLDESKRQLAFDVDEWNPDGESLVWVMVPELRNGMTIRCYYGSEADPNGGLTAAKWPGYAGVWHMNAAEGVEADATANGLDAVPTGNRLAEMVRDSAGGVVGHARVNQLLPRDSSGVMNALLVPNYDHLGLGSRFTVSGWFKATKVIYWERLLSRKTGYSERGGWEVELSNSSTKAYLRGGNNTGDSVTFSDLTDGWVHLSFVYDGSTATCYCNGGETVTTVAITRVEDNSQPLAIGCDADVDERAFAGSYDEVRLCAGAADANRVKAEYLTVADRAFLTYGTASRNPPGLILVIK